MTEGWEAEALEALALVHHDPTEAARRARVVIETTDQPRAESIAERALALALKEGGDPVAALSAIQRALEAAVRADAMELQAQAQMSASLIHLELGDSAAARAASVESLSRAEGAELPRARAQHALILQRLGQTSEALSFYRESIPSLRLAGDEVWLCRALSNRAVLSMYTNDLDDALGDLTEAARRSELIGQTVIAARCEQNLGCVEARRGNVPLALSHFDRAVALCRTTMASVAGIEADRCEALLLGGLFDDAAKAALVAVGLLAANNAHGDLAEAELQLARALLGAERFADAAVLAGRAAERFETQDRRSWACFAQGLAYLAAANGMADDRNHADRGAALARRLDDTGWADLAARVRIGAAAIAEGDGLMTLAGDLLREAGKLPPRPTIEHRLAALEARISLARIEHRSALARRAFLEAARIVRAQRRLVPVGDLHVGLASRHLPLLRAALRAERPGSDPWRAIETVELLSFVPKQAQAEFRPRRHDDLTRALSELRSLRAPWWTDMGDDPIAASRRAAALEQLLLAHDRSSTHAAQGDDPLRRLSLRDWLAAAPDTTVLHVSHDGDRLRARIIGPRRRLVVDLSSELPLDVIDLAGLAGEVAADPSVRNRRALERVSCRVGEMLGPAVRAAAGTSRLVVVPGPLGRVPWGLVPGVRERAYTVTPSLSTLVEIASLEVRGAGTIAVSGPDLPAGVNETAHVAASYRSPLVLDGMEATPSAVASGLIGMRVAHVAAHGDFPRRQPDVLRDPSRRGFLVRPRSRRDRIDAGTGGSGFVLDRS